MASEPRRIRSRRFRKVRRPQREWARLAPINDPLGMAELLAFEGLGAYLAPASYYNVVGRQILSIERKRSGFYGRVKVHLVNGTTITIQVDR